MAPEDKMSVDERRKYLHKVQERYERADRTAKGALLDEMMAVTGLHRQSLARLMGQSLARRERCRQRGRSYGAEVDDALRVIVEAYSDICAERLQPNLAEMAEHLAQHDELVITDHLLEQLKRISIRAIASYWDSTVSR